MWKNTDGYWRMMKNGKQVLVHRYVWELINGEIPDGYVLHHGDGKGNFDGEGNRNCNCAGNLMLLTSGDHNRLHKTGTIGKKHSEETKKRISEAKKGRKHSEETKAKMRKPKSEETKAKMRKPKSEEAKANMRKPKNRGRNEEIPKNAYS